MDATHMERVVESV